MKKIIAAFDGLNFSRNTLEQAIRLAGTHKAHLVGIFLLEFIHRSYALFEVVTPRSDDGKSIIAQLSKDDKITLQSSINSGACRQKARRAIFPNSTPE